MQYDQNELLEIQNKKQIDEDAIKLYCRGCKKVIFPHFQCACSGKAGGGESGGNTEEQPKNDNATFDTALTSAVQTRSQELNSIPEPILSLDESINFARLARLIELGAVALEIDVENLTLTIRVLSRLSVEDQKILFDCMNAIRKEYCEFAKENGLIIINDPLQENLLRITINNPQLFAQFIERINNKYLLKNSAFESFNEEKEQNVNKFHPTPFSKELKRK